MNEEVMKEKVLAHDRLIEEHGKDINELKLSRVTSELKIDTLCEKLEAQTKSINWLIGLMVTGLLGFFFYAVQQGIFK